MRVLEIGWTFCRSLGRNEALSFALVIMHMVPASHEHISKDPHVLLLLIKAQSTLVLSKVQCVIFSEHFKPIAPVFEIDFWQLALLEVRA
jgi:hypothetical protein